MLRNKRADLLEIMIFMFGIVIVILVIGATTNAMGRQSEIVVIREIDSTISIMADAVLNAPECALYVEEADIEGAEPVLHKGVVDWDKLYDIPIEAEPEDMPKVEGATANADCVTKGPYVWRLAVKDLEKNETKYISSKCDATVGIRGSDLGVSIHGDSIIGEVNYPGFSSGDTLSVTKKMVETCLTLPEAFILQIADLATSRGLGTVKLQPLPRATYPVTIARNKTYVPGEATFILGSIEIGAKLEECPSKIIESMEEYQTYKSYYDDSEFACLGVIKIGACEADFNFTAFVVDEEGDRKTTSEGWNVFLVKSKESYDEATATAKDGFTPKVEPTIHYIGIRPPGGTSVFKGQYYLHVEISSADKQDYNIPLEAKIR